MNIANIDHVQIPLLLSPETIEILLNALTEVDLSPPGTLAGYGASDCLTDPDLQQALGELLIHKTVNRLLENNGE